MLSEEKKSVDIYIYMKMLIVKNTKIKRIIQIMKSNWKILSERGNKRRSMFGLKD